MGITTSPLPALGLIAGQGTLPVETARGMKAAGHRVICAALAGQTLEDQLRPHCDVFTTVGLIRINQWIRVLKRHGCTEAVMVGRVAKEGIYQRFHLFRYLPDWRVARVWFYRLRHDKRNDALLRAVAAELASGGIHLIDGRPFVPNALATQGVMTKRQPSAAMLADADFAWPILRAVNELLVGQSVAVKDREIIAIEAVEGTDRLMERAGALCQRGGWVLCKASNPNQDMRFDVPTVGVQTVENLRKHGGGALFLEAGRTIMLEREQLL
ncbi:MAG: UDP-2,3-diacylglucosamine diphosphatase LpxI, partial [Phycisphaerae bacterium]